MTSLANVLADYLLEAEGDLARQFILGTRPEDVKRREQQATAAARAVEFFKEYDKKFSARRAMGEVTPDTDAHYFWSKTEKYADGRTAYMVRRNGATKRWVTRPDEFRIPIKIGYKGTGYIDHHNADQFTTVEPPPVPKQLMLRGFKKLQ